MRWLMLFYLALICGCSIGATQTCVPEKIFINATKECASPQVAQVNQTVQVNETPVVEVEQAPRVLISE